MVVNSINEVASQIDAHIQKRGGGYSNWYCGIASEPRQRLFVDHNVDEKNGSWIYKDAGSENAARQIEQHFLNKGCKGSGGGGDYTTHYVYAYRITSSTRE